MKKYYLYRAVLMLYPASFRRHYQNEMILVLNDLLEAETSAFGKFAVWVRVGSELPLSIIQENIHNIGEKTMNKMVLRKNRKLILGTVIAVVALIVVLSLTVLKNRIAFEYIKYKNSDIVTQETTKQHELIGNPVSALTTQDVPVTANCNLVKVPGLSAQVYCLAEASRFRKIKDIGSEADVSKRLDATENLLKAQGYEGGGNDVTLKSLVLGTYKGIDYSPDATYTKTVDGYDCSYTTTVAFSNPAEAAINTMFTCGRAYNL